MRSLFLAFEAGNCRWQVGQKLAELVHETAGSAGFGGGSYLAASGAGGSCAPDWREAFLAAAMELIALTTPGVFLINRSMQQ